MDQKLADIKDTMNQNINLAIVRGENLEDLSTKSEELQRQASQFHQKSANVKKRMCRDDCMLKGGIVVGLFIVVMIIGMVIYYAIKS